MILGKLGEPIVDFFTVVNQNNELVTGLSTASFTGDLFDPDDTNTNSMLSFQELGNGHYKASFTPNKTGSWYLTTYHPTHFPWGKSNQIQVFTNVFDDLAESLRRILGLTQENFYVDETTYDVNGNLTASRIRIYTDAVSVGSLNNVLATYNTTATYSAQNVMETYQVVKS